MAKKKKQKEKIDWRVMVAGIAALAVIECFALAHGVNGKLFALIAGIIGLAIGVVIPNPIKK